MWVACGPQLLAIMRSSSSSTWRPGALPTRPPASSRSSTLCRLRSGSDSTSLLQCPNSFVLKDRQPLRPRTFKSSSRTAIRGGCRNSSTTSSHPLRHGTSRKLDIRMARCSITLCTCRSTEASRATGLLSQAFLLLFFVDGTGVSGTTAGRMLRGRPSRLLLLVQHLTKSSWPTPLFALVH